MNTDDVRAELDRIGTDPSRYSLKGGTPDDGFALKREGGRWIVYYSERGGRYNIETFTTEYAACRYLLSLLTGTDFYLDDPSDGQQNRGGDTDHGSQTRTPDDPGQRLWACAQPARQRRPVRCRWGNHNRPRCPTARKVSNPDSQPAPAQPRPSPGHRAQPHGVSGPTGPDPGANDDLVLPLCSQSNEHLREEPLTHDFG
jgi:hypothetical protein